MLYNKNMLRDIDEIIKAADEASGQRIGVVFTEFPRKKDKEVHGLLSLE